MQDYGIPAAWALLLASLRPPSMTESGAGAGAEKPWKPLPGRHAQALRIGGGRLPVHVTTEGEKCLIARVDATAAIRTALRSQGDGAVSELLTMAVASLSLFLQANVTGPPFSLPQSPFALRHDSKHSSTDISSSQQQQQQQQEQQEQQERSEQSPAAAAEADVAAAQLLAANGEEVVGSCACPQYLLLAGDLLTASLGQLGKRERQRLGLPWLWWAARSALTQQKLLTGHAASLHDVILSYLQQVTEGLQAEVPSSVLPHLPLLRAAAQMELAGALQYYRRMGEAAGQLRTASRTLDVTLSVTGALGVRTAHQADAKAQLVLQKSRPSDSNGIAEQLAAVGLGAAELPTASKEQPHEAAANGDAAGGATEAVAAGVPVAELDGVLLGGAVHDSAEEPDVLPAPRLTAEHAGVLLLSPIEQALAIAQAVQVQQGTAADEMQPWQAAPFIDAVLAQPQSYLQLRASCLLLRARHEVTRTRTREHAVATLRSLAQTPSTPFQTPSTPSNPSADPTLTPLPSPDTGATSAAEQEAGMRLIWAHTVPYPVGAVLQQEVGLALLSAGLVGEAMDVFEKLRLWGKLLGCYRLLGKQPQALDLVQKRLQEKPEDASLLCALGELTGELSHFRKAWEASRGRSTRAQRSLAAAAMQKQDFAQAAKHWETALSINPLNPEGWFALGHCALKTDPAELPEAAPQPPAPAIAPASGQLHEADAEEAEEAGSLQGAGKLSTRELRALQAFTKCVHQAPDHAQAWNNLAALHLKVQRYKQAFWALSEAVKLSRDAWQLWSNFALAAVRSGNFLPAARAVLQVQQLSGGQQLELEVVQLLTQRLQTLGPPPEGLHPQQPGAQSEAVQLPQLLGKALEAAGSSPGSSAAAAKVWDLQAQFYAAMHMPAEQHAALLKQVRSLAATPWQREEPAFASYAAAAADLAHASIAAFDKKPSKASLSSVRLILRSIAKQGHESYPEHSGTQNAAQALQAIEAAIAGLA